MRRVRPAVVWATGGIVTLMVLVALLAWLGLRNPKSDWSTFYPDLIVGLVTAALVGAILALVQHYSAESRHHDDKVAAAYDNLLEAVARLRMIRFDGVFDVAHLNTWSTRLIQLSELVDAVDRALPRWFEAERQLALHYAGKAREKTEALVQSGEPYTADDILGAGHQFYRWTADFGDNVRYWRTGKLAPSKMNEQSQAIEARLREAGVWRDDHPWRKR